MSNQLPDHETNSATKLDESSPRQPSVKIGTGHFEKNGIGIVTFGQPGAVEMDKATFIDNGVAIVSMHESIDEKLLQALSQFGAKERFEFANELSDIAKADSSQQETMIRESSVVEKLSAVADVATVSTWLANIYAGASAIDFDKLIQTIMGG